jgi:hypothetical protein
LIAMPRRRSPAVAAISIKIKKVARWICSKNASRRT